MHPMGVETRKRVAKVLAPDDMECVQPDCDVVADQAAPVQLCPRHLRLAFAFVVTAERPDIDIPEPEPAESMHRRHVARWGEAGFVYFARIGDVIKIGFSRDPKLRARQLGADALLHAEPGTWEDEQRLHAAFVHLKVPGRSLEYFHAGPDLLSFIKRLHCGVA